MKRHPDALINRANWKDTRAYLRYCLEVRQNGERTIESIRGSLDNLLAWATDIPLSHALEIRPTLVSFMDGRDISPAYRGKVLEYIRAFLDWARDEFPDRYPFKRSWIESLKSKVAPADVAESRAVFTLEMVRAITALTPRTLAERRDIAAVAFLFLSGMRDGAFCTLPIRSVDWTRDPVLVRQWPSWGVRTKNSKAANTFLLPHEELEDLRQIAVDWQRRALEAVGELGMWYTVITDDGGFDELQEPGEHRASNLAKRLRLLCTRAGIPYYSPHKIRHGHVIYAMSYCESMDELKAVSQNVMHESLVTTEKIYGDLPTEALASALTAMSRKAKDEAEGLKLASSLFRKSVRKS